MRLLLLRLGAISILMFGSGCMISPPHPARSALETREIQTRNFETHNTKLVMKAVLNALQDEGFITNNAVVDLGLITATKEVDTQSDSSAFFGTLLMGNEATWEKASVMEATINVSEFGKQTRVRVSFHRKLLNNHGGLMSVAEVSEPLAYQDFFSKIDKSIFIQGADI
jgi:hypothetical protein